VIRTSFCLLVLGCAAATPKAEEREPPRVVLGRVTHGTEDPIEFTDEHGKPLFAGRRVHLDVAVLEVLQGDESSDRLRVFFNTTEWGLSAFERGGLYLAVLDPEPEPEPLLERHWQILKTRDGRLAVPIWGARWVQLPCAAQQKVKLLDFAPEQVGASRDATRWGLDPAFAERRGGRLWVKAGVLLDDIRPQIAHLEPRQLCQNGYPQPVTAAER
jgi:hypothetical protein